MKKTAAVHTVAVLFIASIFSAVSITEIIALTFKNIRYRKNKDCTDKA